MTTLEFEPPTFRTSDSWTRARKRSWPAVDGSHFIEYQPKTKLVHANTHVVSKSTKNIFSSKKWTLVLESRGSEDSIKVCMVKISWGTKAPLSLEFL